ncbi:MAG TPA: T9SS type A sorting domain-containing protein [Lutibacter sp.]|nr:T9SS type A sorting domain-containing protein [Lutibacter sp.]
MKTSILVFLTFVFLSASAQNLYPTLHDQSGGITDGYGSWGEYNTTKEANVVVPDKGTITFYHPDIAATQLGTIFFISGWGREAVTYEAFFYFMASQGYAVVNIYNTNPGAINESYQNSVDMMLESANNLYSNWIDTTKIGLMGHSYGAGSTIWIGNEIFGTDYNWGSSGRFIFMTAPWLSFLMDKDALQNYPDDVKLLIEISDDDFSTNAEYTWNTDERAIRAVYELINIPNDEKDFVRVLSNPTTFKYQGVTYAYDASHYVSYTGAESGGVLRTYDAMDVYAVNRLSHALIDYVFEGNTSAKEVALGNGSTSQIDMGNLTDLFVTDTPIVTRPENEFLYRCSETTAWGDPAIWKLQDYCNDTDNDGVIDYLGTTSLTQPYFTLYPVPTSSLLNIRFVAGFERIESLEIKDNLGRIIKQVKLPNSYSIDTSELTIGTYFITIRTAKHSSTQKIIIK